MSIERDGERSRLSEGRGKIPGVFIPFLRTMQDKNKEKTYRNCFGQQRVMRNNARVFAQQAITDRDKPNDSRQCRSPFKFRSIGVNNGGGQ